MVSALVKLLVGLITAYGLLVVVMYSLQRQLVYAPSVERVEPGRVGLPDVKVVTLTTQSGDTLYNWFVPAQTGMPTLLYFHGNGGAVHGRASIIRQYMDVGMGVFIVGYPGYGGSGGSPDEQSLIAAGLNAYDHLVASLPEAASNLVIYGESLGSAIATQVAAQRQARALVLAAPMKSVEQIAQDQYPFLPVGLLIKDKFRSFEFIESIDMPLLVVHGDQDRIIPIQSGRELFALAQTPKRLVVLEGAGHNNLYDFPIIDIVREFLVGERTLHHPTGAND